MKYLIVLIMTFGIYQPTSESSNRNKMNQLIVSDESGQCLDELMYTWFIKFHEMQEKGYDMSQADQLANDHAIHFYEICK